MKKTIKLAVVAALALGTTSAFATNGDLMIGQGAKARSMGGVGVATSFGAESGLANPALISSVENSEVTGAVTFFMPSVDFASNAAANAATNVVVPVNSSDSAADFSVIPEVAFAQRIDDNIVYGLSMTGVAGMGTDYSDEAFGTTTDNGAFNMTTELQIMKIAAPISYEMSGFSLGLAPVLQYGSLQLSHQISDGIGGFNLLDNGASSDIGFGFEVGMAYDFKDSGIEGLTAGLVYKSKIEMEYEDTIGASIDAFGGAVATGVASGDNLDQPAEFGIGLSYEADGSTIALDYRNIAWGDAAGYADFGWEDQTVIAIGYEYATSGWAIRAGYNYAENAIVEQDGSATGTGANYAGAVQNFFNLSGFPGIVESHVSFGGGYSLSKDMTLDAAFIYAPEVSVSYDTTGMTEAFALPGGNTASADSTADVNHSQMGLTVAVSYIF